MPSRDTSSTSKQKRKTKTKTTLTKAILDEFTDGEISFYRPFVYDVFCTTGVRYVAEHGNADWIIDEIAFAQAIPGIAKERFQVWKLTVNPDHGALLTCTGGKGRLIHTKKFKFTDFPLDEITFHFKGKEISLPSEC